MASLTDGLTYDVFLSFRGTDTRYGFTGNLWKALHDRGIRTFIDDEELRKGEEITPSLLKAIEESRIAIIVLSKNYAFSSFCLRELSMILDCMKEQGQLVWPVFYNVDPSHVRRLTGTYGEAMAKHEARYNDNIDRLQKWKNALSQVANLSGFHYSNGDGYEHEFIDKIVEQVSREIKPVTLPIADYLVGLESQKQNVISLLNVGSDARVHMVGIHGIGGIGKTTLALEVYNLMAHLFEVSCFLENVRENSEKHGLLYLQKILLSEVVGEKIELTSVKQGISIIQQRLRQKKVLLLLDDVDNLKQLQAIVGRPEWFGHKSRVIITTRDTHLLTCHGVESTYEVMELNKKDAFQLLILKAFKTNKVSPSYVDVLNRAVTYASGLPLALEVIGSHLFKKGIQEWESALDRYERIPNKEIQKILKVSFDALEEEEKSVFLDIACCFKGYKLAMIEKILHAHHGDSKKDHISVLVEKSLIKISGYGWVTLHDLMEDMGKEIVRQESPKDPGKRSRLWFPEDIVQVLEEKMGTGKIEILFLDSRIKVKCDGKPFKKLENLRTLIVRGCDFSESPIHLPNSLRVLEWRSFCSWGLKFEFHPKKLAICNFAFGDAKSFVWVDLFKKKFENMRVLNFDYCSFLTRIPDISSLLNLEAFSLQHCENLIKIDDSVGFLDKLKILSVKGCTKVMSIPPLQLASLEELHLSSCANLESFPHVVVGFLGKAKILSINNCVKLRSIPPLKLSLLEQLDVSYCDSLESFPTMVDGLLVKLKILRVNSCNKLKSIPRLKLASLEILDLSHCEGLESFPPVVDGLLDKLKILKVNGCSMLRSIPPLKLASLEELDLSFCDSLERFAPVVDGFLDKLKILRANGCSQLRSIPPFKSVSIEELHLPQCQSLESFPHVVDGLLDKLKILRVNGCKKLRSIPPLKLASLEELDLSYCDSLESFPPTVVEFLGKVKILRVNSCSKLRSIPSLKLALLEQLDLSYCDSLESFPPVMDGLLDKLKILRVNGCSKLRSFPPLKLASLEQLDLSYCDSLESFPHVADGLLDKLKILRVTGCSQLRSISPLKLASLEQLDLSYCDSLESFPPVVDGLLDKLKILKVNGCSKLKSIPPLKLALLEELDLSFCVSLEGFLHVDGLLGKPEILGVDHCHKVRSVPPLELASLVQLRLSYCVSLKNFPPVVDGFLGKLKILRADHCCKLSCFPPLKLPSLEQLDLSYCDSLESFPFVNGLLSKLKFLSARGCSKLRSIQPLKLASLEELNISNCDSLECFPEILGEMENITHLHLDRTPVSELPFSFQNLTRLKALYICNCGIVQFPCSIVVMSELAELTIEDGGWLFPKQDDGEEKVSPMQSSQVEFLHLRNCNLSYESLAIGLKWFANVKELCLSGSKFTILPDCIENCHFLWKLILDNCKELMEIKGIPPSLKSFCALNCKSLTSLCKRKFLNQELHEAGNTIFLLPRAKIPEWFDHKCIPRFSIPFWFRNKFPAIALCVVSPFTWNDFQTRVRVIINGNTFFYGVGENTYKQSEMCHLLLFHMQLEKFNDNLDNTLLKNKWNHAEVDSGFPFLISGIHVLKEKSSIKDIRFTNPENDVNTELTL